MPINVSITDYCKDPQKYKNDPSLDKQTLDYWNSYCDIQKTAGKIKLPNFKDLGMVIPKAYLNFLTGLFSPQSLEILGGVISFNFTYKMAKSALQDWVTGGLNPDLYEEAVKLAEEGLDEGVVNSAMIFSSAAERLTVEEVGMARYVASELIEGAEILGSALGDVLMVQMIVQMVGMALDMWDPCHYNDELDSSSLTTFNNLFNKVFRDNVILQVNTITDSYGHVTAGNVWPIEFYADTILNKEKEDYYSPLRFRFMARYLSSLQYNSDGLPIDWTPNPNGRIFNNSDFWIVERTVADYFGNDNTVIANFFLKWWPFFLLLIVIIIIILFIVRSRTE